MSLSDNQLVTRFRLLAPREKVLIVISVAVVVLYLWFTFSYEPASKRQKAAEEQLSELQTESQTLTNDVADLQRKARSDPNAAAAAQLASLRKEEAQLDNQIRRYTDQLVTPQQMVGILREMLLEQPGLTLLQLESLPPVTLFDSSEAAAEAKAAENADEEDVADEEPAVVDTGLKLYRHTVRMELQGDFFSTVEYLKLMEQLQKKVLWDSLHYKVKVHPTARITIDLFTLSFQRGVIGV